MDTASPQGRFTLQILGAMAEFERALIRERTMSGLAAARAEGRTGGNPGLVSGDLAVLSRLRLARRDAFLERLNRSAGDWAPDVRRLRPEMPWQDVLAVVNSRLPDSRRWTLQRLVRAARAYVAEGLLPETVLGRAAARRKDDRLPTLVAAMRASRPDVTLQEMCDMLEEMHVPTPRGRDELVSVLRQGASRPGGTAGAFVPGDLGNLSQQRRSGCHAQRGRQVSARAGEGQPDGSAAT